MVLPHSLQLDTLMLCEFHAGFFVFCLLLKSPILTENPADTENTRNWLKILNHHF